MPDLFADKTPGPTPVAMAASIEQTVIPVSVDDGSRFELLCVYPAGAWRQLLYWLPAMGTPARHYLPLAEALAARGIAVAVHEWRGIGSSNRRAGRRDDWGYRELLAQDLPAAQAAVHMRWPQASCWLGGHSLGGQLGSMYASLDPSGHAGPGLAGLVLVASGAPYWRRFRWGGLIGMAYVLAPWLARLFGYLPGRAALAFYEWRRRLGADLATAPRNPLQLSTAVTFAALLIFISIVTAWVRTSFGAKGILALSAVVGVTDIDPFILNIAQGGISDMPVALLAAAVLIAAASNNVAKSAYAVGFGGQAARRPASLLMLLALATIGAAAIYILGT